MPVEAERNGERRMGGHRLSTCESAREGWKKENGPLGGPSDSKQSQVSGLGGGLREQACHYEANRLSAQERPSFLSACHQMPCLGETAGKLQPLLSVLQS